MSYRQGIFRTLKRMFGLEDRVNKPFKRPGYRPEVEGLEELLLLSGVPTLPSIVSVQARQVVVQERLADNSLGTAVSLLAHGINWEPTSIGTAEANLTQEFVKWYKTDIPLMAKMGVNVVHVYHDFGTGAQTAQALAILDEFYRYRIGVIMTVDSPTGSTTADAANIPKVVNAYKSHPAIILWCIGNEWNLASGGRYYNGTFATLSEAAAFVNQSALTIKSLDTTHPVTSILIDDSAHISDLVNNQAPDVDVWTINVFRNKSFGTFFQEWKSVSTKPMILGEFGADRFDHRVNAENQAMQADMNGGLWDEIDLASSAERFDGVAVGGLVFEFEDEWHKNGDPSTHNVSGETNYGQPDLVNDEEFFGLFDIDRMPKLAVSTLTYRFLGGQAAVAFDSTPTLQAVSQYASNGAEFHIGGKTVYQKLGGAGGGRGINVAVLDAKTGIRMSDTRNFDTWASTGGFGGPHEHFQELIAYLNSVAPGSIILLSIGDEGGFVTPSGVPWSDSNVEQGYQALEALGSTQIRQVTYRGGWAMITIKGQGALAEVHSDPGVVVTAQAQVSLTIDPNFGRRPGVTINQFPDGTILSEGGAGITSTIALATQPTSNVVITLTPNGRDAGSPTTLTFSSSNWKTPQTVTVTAADNHVVDGTLPGPIQLTASSSDSAYNGIALPSLSVILQDPQPMSDDFNRPNSPNLGPFWTTQAGTVGVVSMAAATNSSVISVATLNNLSLTNVVVKADINVTAAAAHAGLIARYSGTGEFASNFYLGMVYNNPATGKYEAYLFLKQSGQAYQQLGSTTDVTTFFTGAGMGAGSLRFEVIGSQLKLFVNNTLQIVANDSTISAGPCGNARPSCDFR